MIGRVGQRQSRTVISYHDHVMSTTAAAAAAKTPASDKVDVSFETDDEEETSSSEDETTSSSESDKEEKSDADGDADDESEMPTFTLSLQASTETNDADDALPDLSGPAATSSKQETQQETTVKTTGTISETETKVEVTTSRSTTSTTKVDDVSDVPKETPPELSVPAKENVEEASEVSEESEESESEPESEKEDEKIKEQNVLSSSGATTLSATVSTKIDTKEDLTVTSSKLSVTESVTRVKEVEEHVAIAVVETKTVLRSDEATKKNDSVVTEVEDKHSSDIKAEGTSLTKETIVAEQPANVNIDTNENMELSETAAAASGKSKITNDVEIATTSSVQNIDQQPPKTKKKDSASNEAKLKNSKADAIDSTSPTANVTDANDLKHEDGKKETIKSTEEKEKKLSATETAVTKISQTAESEETKQLKTKEQTETVDTQKSKSHKTKVATKEIKQEVTKTVEDEQTASVVVATEENTNKLESEKVKTSKTITDSNSKPKVNADKTKEAHKHDKSDSVSATKTVETTDKIKSEESIKDVTTSTSQATKTNAVVVDVNESAAAPNEQEKKTGTETSEGKLPSKKKSKSTADKEAEVKSVVADSTAVCNDMEREQRKGGNLELNNTMKSDDISSTVAASEAGKSKSSIFTVADFELEKKVTETRPNKDTSLSAANFSDKVKVTDTKLNGVEDEGKLLTGDDTEFRPRRNSIDEFIKRILAEAREEQKNILDSCAVASSAETTSETGTSANIKVAIGTELEVQQQQQQPPIVNGVDVGLTTRPVRRNREDLDIDDALADISRYYAKRALVDRVATDDAETAEFGSAQVTRGDESVKSKIVANGDDRLPPTSTEEVLHFVPQRRESTANVVRESSRPVRVLVDQQTSVIRQLTEASRSIDELDNEIRQLRQTTGGREAMYSSIGAAIRDELRIYEMELAAAGERLGQQRLPGGRFIREQFVAQCAAELLQRSATTNGPRLDRAVSVDEWTRSGRRRAGSFSAAVDEDVGSGLRTGARPWLPAAFDRDTTDLMIQYRHGRSGSVVSDRGYSSVDTADESRATTSSLLSRLSVFSGSTTTPELDFGRSRASSEAPRPSYHRPQTTSDDWLSTNSPSYSVERQYVGYGFDSPEDTNGELQVEYRVSTARPAAQPSYRRYQPPSVDTATAPHSRLYARRGSLQGYSSYDSGTSNETGRSFNSRFLSRVREKKALGETTSSRQATGDRPFRSRFLKSPSVTGSTSTTYSSSRSAGQFDFDDN